ncbi:LysR substrate-binding domain-containing protein [Luteococcus peritonei]
MRGVVLHKWQRTWEERFRNPLHISEVADEEQLTGLREGSLDMCFVRLPIDREGLHAIPLYEEQMVAWVAKDHLFAAADELTMAEVSAEETVLTELDAIAIDRVLVGAVLVVPMSIARGASRRDLVYRPITDAEPSPVALAWRMDDENPLLDEFVGVVRGRSANSSRTEKERAASGSKPVKARPQTKKPSRPRKVRRGH